MNRRIRSSVFTLAIVGALSLGMGGLALAQQAHASDAGHVHGHKAGLLGEALKLDSLTVDQRAAISDLVNQRHAASAPVRQADAQFLTALAQEVEQATIDRTSLSATLSAEDSAAVAQSAAEKDAINRLHALLTPAQRNQLVDLVEAGHPRGAHQGTSEHGAEHHGRGWGGGGGGTGAGSLGLTAEQRSQIAANLRAEWQANTAGAGRDAGRGAGPGAGHRQALEAFRGDSFDASSLVHVERRGERTERLAEAMVPVLTPAQRGVFAQHLRDRAARESRG